MRWIVRGSGWPELTGEDGLALGVVIVSAIAFTAASVAVLTMSLSRTQMSRFDEDRLQARYAAEAGLVWTMQRLWNEASTPYPPGCPPGNTGTDTMPFDTDGDGSNETTVRMTITNCGAGNQHQIQTKVTY